MQGSKYVVQLSQYGWGHDSMNDEKRGKGISSVSEDDRDVQFNYVRYGCIRPTIRLSD